MKHYCVISHTHWDREWYQTQEEFRLRLIDLFDHLLKILDDNPDYVFHMDAQTIVFEDYWEIKPEMKEKCCRHIREGRILAGPWYVQNDFFLTSGEATVRNLLIGMKQAEEMGHCEKVGYTPDQFGLISQLPQILRGFEIECCMFGRGYLAFEEVENETIVSKHKPAEFLWKSPDGSEVFAICMSYWYNNAQRFSADIERAYHLTQNIKSAYEGVATTPYLLLMNGVDHLEPQPDLLPILRELQKRLPKDEKIYQTTLQHYVELVRKEKNRDELPVEVGELMQGLDGYLLKDTASSRIYLKTANCELQNMLENRLEPLYTLLELWGIDEIYPAGEMDYLWKMLIRNHAHDSICGCSKDAVHRHMEDRFAALREMSKELMKRGMRQLATHICKRSQEDLYQIIIFNGLEKDRTEVVDVDIDVVATDEPVGIRVVAPNGQEIPIIILEKQIYIKSVFSAWNLPGRLKTKRYKIRMLAENVPAFGYNDYAVQINKETVKYINKKQIVNRESEGYCLENKYLKVVICFSGKVDLFHKESDHCYKDILAIQDVADVGHSYISKALVGDEPVNVIPGIPQISIVESDDLKGVVCLKFDVAIPAYFDAEKQKRSDETVIMPIKVLLGLEKEATSLNISFEIENYAKDHRMRALIRTGLNSDITLSSAPYDIICHDKWKNDKRICNETEHNSGMVAIGREDLSLAVLNKGIYGYENLQNEQGTLAFTIVRSTGTISDAVEFEDDAWKIPENQCLRKICCEISIFPQVGDTFAPKAAFAAKVFQNPLEVQCEPTDGHKFLGGSPAVQDTSIAELFYQDVPDSKIILDTKGTGFFLEGDGLQVTALKKAFDRTGYILRFYNSGETEMDAVLYIGHLAIKKVWKTNLKETTREEIEIIGDKIEIHVKAKEIVTLFFQKDDSNKFD